MSGLLIFLISGVSYLILKYKSVNEKTSRKSYKLQNIPTLFKAHEEKIRKQYPYTK
jgi:hypothetical protein